MKKDIVIAFCGNPNTGKTSLINTLSHSHLKIGNWPGVTVSKKEAKITKDGVIIHLTDLPGVYALQKDSKEERITHKYIYHDKPDIIVNVIEATNLKSSLPLTLDLIRSGIPVVIVLNFWDEFVKSGNTLNVDALSSFLGVPIFQTEANVSIGKSQLLDTILAILSLEHRKSIAFPRAVEPFIEHILSSTLTLNTRLPRSTTDRIDGFVLHKWFSVPFLLFVFYLMFKVTFDGSSPLIDWIDGFVNVFIYTYLSHLLSALQVTEWVSSLILDGIVAGIGTVLTFIPLMFILYACISIFEESGFIARVAYIMDRMMRPLGIQGKAFIPILVGFGCSVPAIYATRTLDRESDRKVTAIVTSFISCGAKLPIYVLFTYIFFRTQAVLITMSMYAMGVFVAVLWAFVLKRYIYKEPTSNLIIELPQYRLPSVAIVVKSAYAQTVGFVRRAGTMIALVVILIWSLSNLPYGTTPEKSLLGNMARIVSPVFVPLGWGSSWQATASVIPGFLAKEAVVGALATAYHTGEEVENMQELSFSTFLADGREQVIGLFTSFISTIQGIFSTVIPGLFVPAEQEETVLTELISQDLTPLKAFSYMTFNLLLLSCVAVMGAVRQEFGFKFFAISLCISISTAYSVSFIVYTIGRLLSFT